MTKDLAPGLAERALFSAERHGRSLKAVNEKLADLVASLRDQKQRLSASSRPGEPAAAGKREMPMDSSPGERSPAAELAVAQRALQDREEEQARLRDRLAEIEAENRRVSDEFVAVQDQNAELVSLYAAIERLHGAPTRTDVVTAIQEIVVNLVGSEEFALFELTPDGRRLSPAHAFGVKASSLKEIAVGSEAAAARDELRLAAFVPLKLGEKVTGAVAIYRLLAHKSALTDFDRELFSVLERHAALALHFRAPERPTGSR
jgi:hypothetical protein